MVLKILVGLVVLVVLVVAVVGVLAALQPSEFRITRTATIAAPAAMLGPGRLRRGYKSRRARCASWSR